MQNDATARRIAVCSWSFHPSSPQHLIERLRVAGIPRVQLALDPLRESPAEWGDTAALFRENGIGIVSGMFGCVGEDYTTMETIHATGGLVPDATWEQNWKRIRAMAPIARELGLNLVTLHAGFIPGDQTSPQAARLRERMAQVAAIFQEGGVALGLETGQEDAPTLRHFLETLGCPGVGVNFDPANMILYDKGDPVQAVRALGPWIRQIHIKDARRTKIPGTWGEEVVPGTGEVDWAAFFAALNEVNFTGDFCIEREARDERLADIHAAHELVGRFLSP